MLYVASLVLVLTWLPESDTSHLATGLVHKLLMLTIALLLARALSIHRSLHQHLHRLEDHP